MSEDNPLANVDLGVVTAARAPQGFAEGVLARFATTEAAIAVAKRGRGRRMAWIAGGSLAAAAAVIAVVVLWPASNPEPRSCSPRRGAPSSRSGSNHHPPRCRPSPRRRRLGLPLRD